MLLSQGLVAEAGVFVAAGIFLPDAVRWSGICYGDVAVCVSVTLMYCAHMTESIIMQPSPDCSPTILVFPYQI